MTYAIEGITAADVVPGMVIRHGRRWLTVAVTRKGRLIVGLDLMTLRGYYAGSVNLPSDALVIVR